jgi:hypothetical protein
MANGQHPVVQVIQLFESVARDPATNALMWGKLLHGVDLPPGPPFLYLLDEIWLYAQLTGPAGTYELSAECRLPGTPWVLGRSGESRTRFPGNGIIEYACRFPQLPLPTPGQYEFRVLADGVPLEPPVRLLVR